MTNQNSETPVLMAAMLLLVAAEACFIHWLRYLPPDQPLSPLELLTMPPWYKQPKFEISLLLTVLAGLIFSAGWAMYDRWRKRRVPEFAASTAVTVRQRLVTAVAVAMLTAADIALITLRR